MAGRAGRAGARALPESPFPPMGRSLLAGARAVAGSPVILATAFLGLLGTWALHVVFGPEPTPAGLAVLVSIPPVHVLGDAFLAIPRGASAAFSLGVVATLALLRALTFGTLCVLILQALRDGRPSARDAIRALPRILLVFAALYVLQFGLLLAGYVIVTGFLGQLGSLVAASVGLYFLAFSPVIAAAEGDLPAQALRRGARAARLPGTGHLLLVMGYVLVLSFSNAVAPFPVVGPATPSIAAWAYGLTLTFVHVSVLAALTYRWLAIREEVPAPAGK